VGIDKIRLLPKSPNPLNTQVSYPSLCFSTHGVFGYKILKIKYNYDYTFLKNKSYFIQLFQKQIIFYSTFYKQIIFYSTFAKKSNLKICKQNKNLILITKIQHSNAPPVSLSISAIIFSSPSLCFSTLLNLLWVTLFFFLFFFSMM
jgi:hypothetical protein